MINYWRKLSILMNKEESSWTKKKVHEQRRKFMNKRKRWDNSTCVQIFPLIKCCWVSVHTMASHLLSKTSFTVYTQLWTTLFFLHFLDQFRTCFWTKLLCISYSLHASFITQFRCNICNVVTVCVTMCFLFTN